MSVSPYTRMNFGYAGGSWSEPLQSQRFNHMWNIGIRDLRIVGAVYTATGTIDQIIQICDNALDFGFGVMNGTTVNGASPLTSTTVLAYEAKVLSIAAHFNAHPQGHKFILWLINEDDPRVDNTTLTKAQFQMRMHALNALIQSTYPKIKTCICCTTAESAYWSSNPGTFHYLCLNVYSNKHTFSSQVIGWKRKLKERAMITEWNSSDFGATDYPDPIAHEHEVASRAELMEKLRMPHYFFSYDASSGTPQQWGLVLNDGTTRRALRALLKPTHLFDTTKYPTVFGDVTAPVHTLSKKLQIAKLQACDRSIKVQGTESATVTGCATSLRNLSQVTLFARVKAGVSAGKIVTKAAGGTGYFNLACDGSSFKFMSNYTGVGQWRTQAKRKPQLWQDIAVTYTFGLSNKPKFYIDGVKQNVLTQDIQPTGTQGGDDGNLYIGNRSGLNAALNGNIQCVQIYNRILTEKELWTLHSTNEQLSGCVANFKANDGTGNLVDSTGLNPNAVLTGSWSVDRPY